MALPTIQAKFFAVLNKVLTDNNYAVIDPAAYIINNPAAYSGSSYPRNSKLILDTPIESANVGRTSVYYDRINLASITGITVSKGASTTITDLLPALSDVLGIQFSANDVIPGTLPGSGPVNISASASNLIYSGVLTVGLDP